MENICAVGGRQPVGGTVSHGDSRVSILTSDERIGSAPGDFQKTQRRARWLPLAMLPFEDRHCWHVEQSSEDSLTEIQTLAHGADFLGSHQRGTGRQRDCFQGQLAFGVSQSVTKTTHEVIEAECDFGRHV